MHEIVNKLKATTEIIPLARGGGEDEVLGDSVGGGNLAFDQVKRYGVVVWEGVCGVT